MDDRNERSHHLVAQKNDEKNYKCFVNHSLEVKEVHIYVLENGNKVKAADRVEKNGPDYLEHVWNPRPLIKSAVS